MAASVAQAEYRVRSGGSPTPWLAMESMEAVPSQWAQVAETGVAESGPSCFESTVKTDMNVPTVAALEVSYPNNMRISKQVFFKSRWSRI
eukprot:12899336-Prorocentrum_lima.AAC.1